MLVRSKVGVELESIGTVSVTDGTNFLSRVANIEGIIDGQADDTFVFEDGAVFNGTIGASNEWFGVLGFNQGAGLNTFDFSAYTTSVKVDLGWSFPECNLLTLPAKATTTSSDGPGGPRGRLRLRRSAGQAPTRRGD